MVPSARHGAINIVAEAERQIDAHPGPCADFMRILVKEYRIAVDQALRLEAIVHEMTKDA